MRLVKILISVTISILIILLPTNYGIEGLTVIEKRVIALFVLAALFWVLEPIPIYATSVLVIVLELIILSDKGFILFRIGSDNPEFGQLLNYKDIFSTFASPIILLFMGGFFLAMAATKYRLDTNLARIIIKPFGTKPKFVILGLMIITAVLSMFMSNTATTAMMLAILTPVLAAFDGSDKGKIALALSIPLAANIGGIGTPIGTPPNAIALKYLVGDNAISFGEWMSFGVPFVIVLLTIAWVILTFLYPSSTKQVNLNIQSSFIKNKKAYIVYATFAGTILLWLTDFVHGMNSYVVAMIPVAVFSTTGIINKEDLKRISWDVLWLVSGGIALGLAMESSGLAKNLVSSIPFENYSPHMIIVGAALLTFTLANFMSHTASANLLMPILAALGTSLDSLAGLGGISSIIIICALAASMGMSLPISTPPNALAHGTGAVNTSNMARVGIIVGFIGLLLAFLTIYILNLINF